MWVASYGGNSVTELNAATRRLGCQRPVDLHLSERSELARLAVESYSVKVGGHAGTMTYGNDLYLVYQPGRQSRLPLDSGLQFIQVLWSHGPSVVDSTTANPFYGSGSGLTSIYGKPSVSFYNNPAVDPAAGSHLPPSVFQAEVFLAQDTGTNDAAGKDIVNIFGGVKWGWQMHSLP